MPRIAAPPPPAMRRTRLGRANRRLVRGFVPVSMAAGLTLGVLGACNDDGRYLRPARPDQVTTISTTTPPSTTLAGAVFDGVDAGADPDGPAATAGILPGGSGSGSDAPPFSVPVGGATAPWRDGAAIDPRHSCDGANVSPALLWPAAPSGTREIAIVMRDEQNPTFIHWALTGIDAGSTGIAEADVPIGAAQTRNSGGSLGYTGPCPPQGTTHTYRITVHYLATQTELGDGAAADDVIVAIDAGTIATSQVTGTFSRA